MNNNVHKDRMDMRANNNFLLALAIFVLLVVVAYGIYASYKMHSSNSMGNVGSYSNENSTANQPDNTANGVANGGTRR